MSLRKGRPNRDLPLGPAPGTSVGAHGGRKRSPHAPVHCFPCDDHSAEGPPSGRRTLPSFGSVRIRPTERGSRAAEVSGCASRPQRWYRDPVEDAGGGCLAEREEVSGRGRKTAAPGPTKKSLYATPSPRTGKSSRPGPFVRRPKRPPTKGLAPPPPGPFWRGRERDPANGVCLQGPRPRPFFRNVDVVVTAFPCVLRQDPPCFSWAHARRTLPEKELRSEFVYRAAGSAAEPADPGSSPKRACCRRPGGGCARSTR